MILKKGDIVDVIAPSSFPANDSWLDGVKILEEWGLSPRFNKETVSPWLFHANTNQRRSEYLNNAFSDSSSQAVWSARGGYGLQKALPRLVQSKVRKKLFIGYSDATALHIYLNSICKIPSLHAPFLADLPLLPLKDLNSLRDVLFGKTQYLEYSNLKVFNKSSNVNYLKEPILGGNLTLLSSSVGCSWMPKKLNSCFLFLEDVNEEDYRIDRALHQLFFSGALKKVKVILLGSFKPVNEETLTSKVIKSFSDLSNIPIVTGLPCGHIKENKPLPLGRSAEIFFKDNKADLKSRVF